MDVGMTQILAFQIAEQRYQTGSDGAEQSSAGSSWPGVDWWFSSLRALRAQNHPDPISQRNQSHRHECDCKCARKLICRRGMRVYGGMGGR